MKRDVRLEKVFRHPPSTVWHALTDPEAVGQWLMKNDFQPRLGHKFQFRAKPRRGWNGITYCEVIELEPEKRLAYTWRGGTGEPGVPDLLDTVVRFTLEPHADGTLLRLEHNGFSGMKAVLVSFMMGAGWAKMMRGRFPALLDSLRRGAPDPGRNAAEQRGAEV
jgi:uncharacterized protein YndB with AHSA1/START domain